MITQFQKKLEVSADLLAAQHDHHLQQMRKHMETILRDVGLSWQKNRRKHRPLRFMNSYGLIDWYVRINNRWHYVEHLCKYEKHRELYKRIFAELIAARDWYIELADYIPVIVEF